MSDVSGELINAAVMLVVVGCGQWLMMRSRWGIAGRAAALGRYGNAMALATLPGLAAVTALSLPDVPEPPAVGEAVTHALVGILVGTGEFGVCGVLTTALVSLSQAETVGPDNWLAFVRSSLVTPYRTLRERLPLLLTVGVVLWSAVTHEIWARAVVAAGAAGAGLGAVLVASACASCVLWAVRPGAWRTVQQGLVVGLVTGLVHGLAYWQTASLVLLVVAHITFVALAVA